MLITVAFLAMFTILVLGFLARAAIDYQVSDSSTNLNSGDLFSRGAVDCIVGDLKQEIVDGSTSTNNLYLPKANVNMVPAYSGINPIITNGLESDGLNNVLKVSSYNIPFYGGASINRASKYATTASSLDNRSVTAAAWNKPLLMPASSVTDLTPPPSCKFPTPNWIYVARDGSNPGSGPVGSPTFGSSGNTANNPSSSNSSFVVGRYAYVVYNEGGLLDVNAAGSPDVSSMSMAQNQIWTRKGSSAFADLTQLPGLTSLTPSRAQGIVDTVLGWRNLASAQPSGSFPIYTFAGTPITNFLNYQIGQTTNWMTTGNSSLYNGQSDRMFTSRQQLIGFLQGVAQTPLEQTAVQTSLQYLGTFSRSLNQPSYAPPANRPLVQGPADTDPGGASTSPYDVVVNGVHYGGNSAYQLDSVFNPVFRSVLVKNSFTRNDGSIAIPGEPLVKKRFALSRLCWLTYKGPSATLGTSDALITQYLADGVSQTLLNEGTAANIYSYFGLTWTGGPGPGGIGGFWTYNHGIINGGTVTLIGSLKDPNSTSKPQDVVSANRDPDFFELLKAGVCAGAIAKTKTAGPSDSLGTNYSAIIESTVTFQVFQLGANIITQASPSQYPVWIKYNYGDSGPYLRSFYGSTDLPYYYSDTKIAYVNTQSSVTPGPWPPTIPPPPPTPVPSPMVGPLVVPPAPTQTVAAAGNIVTMIIPSVWDPYDPSGPGGPNLPINNSLSPSQLRITVVPAALTDFTNIPGGTTPATTNAQWRYTPRCLDANQNVLGTESGVTAKWLTEDSTAMTFSNLNSLYRQPTILYQQNVPAGSNLSLGPSNVIQSTPGGTSAGLTEAGSGTNFIGFLMGLCPQAWSAPTTDNTTTPPTPTTTYYVVNDLLVGHPANGSTIRLEYQAGTSWIPYQEVYINFENDRIPVAIIEAGTTANPSLIMPANAGLYVGIHGQAFGGMPYGVYGGVSGPWGNYAFDPRSTRWGVAVVNPGPLLLNPTDLTDSTAISIRPDGSTTAGTLGLFSGPVSVEGWTDNAGSNRAYRIGGPSQNLNKPTNPLLFYSDPDGIVRRAMGGLVNNVTPSSTVALPMATPPSPYSTPIMLHRPYRSVTELGYVFSDTPWRNIDFFTSESGYAPLLDVFCINEDYRPDALTAGRVDLNTRQEPVLQSLLSGAYRDESAVATGSGDVPLAGGTTGEAATVANLLLARTSPQNSAPGKGPLTNIADLVGHYVAGFANTNKAPYDGFSADLVGSYTGGPAPGNNLIQRFMETTSRALSDAGQVGTWNLLIDVVAQSGRCSANAGDLSNFTVKGERHYWVHVAIDRQTGQVIDENIEPVNL